MLVLLDSPVHIYLYTVAIDGCYDYSNHLAITTAISYQEHG